MLIYLFIILFKIGELEICIQGTRMEFGTAVQNLM